MVGQDFGGLIHPQDIKKKYPTGRTIRVRLKKGDEGFNKKKNTPQYGDKVLDRYEYYEHYEKVAYPRALYTIQAKNLFDAITKEAVQDRVGPKNLDYIVKSLETVLLEEKVITKMIVKSGKKHLDIVGITKPSERLQYLRELLEDKESRDMVRQRHYPEVAIKKKKMSINFEDESGVEEKKVKKNRDKEEKKVNMNGKDDFDPKGRIKAKLRKAQKELIEYKDSASKEELKDLKKEIARLSELNIKRLKEKVVNLKIDVVKEKKELQEKKDEYANLKRYHKSNVITLKDIPKKDAKLESTIKLKAKVDKHEKRLKQLKEEIEKLTKSYGKLKKSKEKAKGKLPKKKKDKPKKGIVVYDDGKTPEQLEFEQEEKDIAAYNKRKESSVESDETRLDKLRTEYIELKEEYNNGKKLYKSIISLQEVEDLNEAEQKIAEDILNELEQTGKRIDELQEELDIEVEPEEMDEKVRMLIEKEIKEIEQGARKRREKEDKEIKYSLTKYDTNNQEYDESPREKELRSKLKEYADISIKLEELEEKIEKKIDGYKKKKNKKKIREYEEKEETLAQKQTKYDELYKEVNKELENIAISRTEEQLLKNENEYNRMVISYQNEPITDEEEKNLNRIYDHLVKQKKEMQILKVRSRGEYVEEDHDFKHDSEEEESSG